MILFSVIGSDDPPTQVLEGRRSLRPDARLKTLVGIYHPRELQATPLVRLKVRTNSGVEVPIGQSTGCR
jgi:hypothetical protein